MWSKNTFLYFFSEVKFAGFKYKELLRKDVARRNIQKKKLANIFYKQASIVDQDLNCYRLYWLECKYKIGLKLIKPVQKNISNI